MALKTKHSTIDLPIIDISIIDQATIDRIEYAFRHFGFLLIKGHELNVSADFETHESFFTKLPSSVLESAIIERAPVPRGYAPVDAENFASLIGENRPNDLNCKYRIGPTSHAGQRIKVYKKKANGYHDVAASAIATENMDTIAMDYYSAKGARCLLFPNVWPSKHGDNNHQQLIDAFQTSMLSVFDRFEAIAKLIFNIFERIFVAKMDGSKLHFNEAMFNQHTSILSTNYYPTNTELRQRYKMNVTDDRMAIEEHTDVDVFTLIAQNNNHGGVQIKVNDEWLSIPCDEKENHLILNIGDGLQYLTGNAWKSTKHRVLIPPHNNSRQVIAFFAAFNHDAVMTQPIVTATEYEELHKEQPIEPSPSSHDCMTYFKWRTKRIKTVTQILKKHKK